MDRQHPIGEERKNQMLLSEPTLLTKRLNVSPTAIGRISGGPQTLIFPLMWLCGMPVWKRNPLVKSYGVWRKEALESISQLRHSMPDQHNFCHDHLCINNNFINNAHIGMIDFSKKHIPQGRTNIHKIYMLPSIKLKTWPLVYHISKYTPI